MDKRIPHRVREVRQALAGSGKLISSGTVLSELCKVHPEYNRIKQQSLKRLISQELSTPLAASVAAAAASPSADDTPTLRSADGSTKLKRKRSAAEQADEPAAAEGDGGETSTPKHSNSFNTTLRRMYNPEAEEQAAQVAQAATAAREKKIATAKERAARAQARRDLGLNDPVGSSGGGFTPEDRPTDRLDDLGGIDSVLKDLRQLIVQPLAHPEVFTHLGVHPPTGVLLHGPPGSGKTSLAHAIAGTTGVTFFKVAATEIVSGMSGESEAKIRQLFQSAIASAPSLLFLDEVDAITPKRDSAGREMERRIVAQLLTCLDDLKNTNVIVLGATNRPDALDPALRRAGRFDREIAMGIPDEGARARILEKMVQGMRLSEGLDIALLAKLTPGFVGADLSALTKEAALEAIERAFASLSELRPAGDTEDGTQPYTPEEMASVAVNMDDFLSAVAKVQPSARREGFSTIPDVKWEDIGALAEVRTDLDGAVCEPIRKAALFRSFGLTVPVGVLLFGPPGCGKTLLAKATANASGANFIAIKGPELLNKYVGESERAVRLVFQRAMTSAPCVIFFDELDALVPRRSGEGSSGAERVVNQMLTEMDGVNERSQVYVIAATNRPDIVDPAMLRPGRLDRLIYVPLPSQAGRLEILQAHMRKLPLAEDVDLPALATECDGFSGADLASLTREAAMLAIRGANTPGDAVTEADVASQAEHIRITADLLARARARVSPSVSPAERRDYEGLASRLCGWKRDPGPRVAKAPATGALPLQGVGTEVAAGAPPAEAAPVAPPS